MDEERFDPASIDVMMTRLEELKSRHRDLDDEINALMEAGGSSFQIMALKREKLRLKDSIAWLMSRLTPDIIA